VGRGKEKGICGYSLLLILAWNERGEGVNEKREAVMLAQKRGGEKLECYAGGASTEGKGHSYRHEGGDHWKTLIGGLFEPPGNRTHWEKGHASGRLLAALHNPGREGKKKGVREKARGKDFLCIGWRVPSHL